MQAIRKILQELNSKDTAFVSQPVLYKDDNRFYIAVYVSAYKNLPDGNKAVTRPQLYCLIDISTGKLVSCEECKKGYLNGTKTRVHYSLPDKGTVSEEEYDKIYELFDSARQAYVEMPDKDNFITIYARYMDGLKALVPEDHLELYNALSVKIRRQEQQKAEKAEEKTEEVPKKEEEHILLWKPEKDLSSGTERMFNILTTVAKKVRILEEDDTKIKYEYPVMCFEKDRKTDADPWLELQARIINNDISTGHFKASKFKSVYMTCTHGKEDCIFGKCPYYAAAYIKKLQKEDPKELERQREESRNNNRKDPDILSYEISISNTVDTASLKSYLSKARAGKLSMVRKNDNEIDIEWIENLGLKGCQIMQRIVKQDSLKDMDGTLQDVNGYEIPESVVKAIMAEYIDATDGWERRKKELEQKTQQEKTEEKKDEASSVHDEELPIPPGMSKESPAWKILSDDSISSFYAILIEGDPEKDNELIDGIFEHLKRKGCMRIERIIPSELPKNADPSVLYIVDIKNSSELHKLKIFTPDGKFILYGDRIQLDFVLRQRLIKSIYGKYILQSQKTDYGAIYKEVIEHLPDNMREECRNISLQQFSSWLKTQSLPLNEEGIAAYVVWLCLLENRLVFAKTAQNRTGGEKN